MTRVEIGAATRGWKSQTIYVHRRGGIEAETMFITADGQQLVHTGRGNGATFEVFGGSMGATPTWLRPYQGSVQQKRRVSAGELGRAKR